MAADTRARRRIRDLANVSKSATVTASVSAGKMSGERFGTRLTAHQFDASVARSMQAPEAVRVSPAMQVPALHTPCEQTCVCAPGTAHALSTAPLQVKFVRDEPRHAIEMDRTHQ